jgi:hypothetical protein
MRLQLQADSRVLIDLRATGVLRAVGHDPTLIARPEAFAIEISSGNLELDVVAQFSVDRIEVPKEISLIERAQMRDNLRGRDVLDAKRFPTVVYRGRYLGSVDRGRLTGELTLLGTARPVEMEIGVVADAGMRRATGTWAGTLTQLGIRPFSALFGALKLQDWIRIRLEVAFA